MNPEHWAQVEELFHRVMECQPHERIAILQEAGSTDPELRREVEELLSSYADAPVHLQEVVGWARSELESGAAASVTPTVSAAGTNSETVIGPYHLLQSIGEGGMGQVWLAEQKQPMRRRVALKLIKTGMNSHEVVTRFEAERQAIALMEHPSIAKVFDAGATPHGAPYFVMEYVAGIPITTYCDNHNLSIGERLELFIRACEGVEHAHQKAIIHRDLKPSNILVTEVDGQATPKIIDFGVAKALGKKRTTGTTFTRAGALVGTPEYMSPEQAYSSGEDIDTRSDVYSLGIVLYELLTGSPPVELQNIPLDEFLRRLHEQDPPKPSTKVRTQDAATSSEVAHKRQTEPLALARQIRGDLDSIALKSLAKERARRYGSAAELAADIRRYLSSQPVFAVPPSAAYLARKFFRRHSLPLAAASVLLMALIGGISVSTWEARRADREAAVAQAVNDFLENDLLAQANVRNQAGPTTKPDADLKVRTALDRAAARIAGKFDRQPELEAAIRYTIGDTYLGLGLYEDARTHFERALELRRRVLGAQNPATLNTVSRLGEAALLQGKYPEAETLLSQTVERERRVLGPEHPYTLNSMNNLAIVYRLQGKYGQAEALNSQTLEIKRRVLGPEHPDTLSSMNTLAIVYLYQGKYGQAEALYSQTLEIRRRVLGPEHPNTLASMNNLALVYYSQGKYGQAEALYSQTLEIQRRVLGPEHPDTLASMNNLAVVYRREGKYGQAEALNSKILEIRRRVLGPEHPDTLASMSNLAIVYYSQGKYGQAEALHSKTLEIQRRVLGAEHPDTLASMSNLALVYSYQGKYGQAEALYSQTLEIKRRVLGPEHPSTLGTLSDFAFMYQRQGKYGLAETQATQALAGRRHALGSEHPDTMASAADLALAYQSQRKFAESEALAREALELERKKQPEDWQRFRAESLLGASLAGEKKYAEGEPLLLEGYQGMLARKDRIAVPDYYHLDLAQKWLVELYEAWGKPEKAAEWRAKPTTRALGSSSKP